MRKEQIIIIALALCFLISFIINLIGISEKEQIIITQTQIQGIPTEQLINLNNATEKELDSLPGIGPVKAKNIILNRPYSNISQLLNVIGEDTYNRVKGLVKIE